jgi:hypothetical protein
MRAPYEFSPTENETIEKVGSWSKILGIIGFVHAGLSLIQGNIMGAGIEFAIAMMFFQAGGAFERVVQTQGDDMRLMMEALEKLGQVFTIRLVLFAIMVVIMICGMVFLLVVGAGVGLH